MPGATDVGARIAALLFTGALLADSGFRSVMSDPEANLRTVAQANGIDMVQISHEAVQGRRSGRRSSSSSGVLPPYPHNLGVADLSVVCRLQHNQG